MRPSRTDAPNPMRPRQPEESSWVSPPGGTKLPSELPGPLQDLLACAQEHVGPLAVVADHNWTHGESNVVEADAGSLGRLFLKAHHKQTNYDAELAAYQSVVPHLGGRAPRLVAFDDNHRLLVLTALRGTRADCLQDDRDYVAAHRLAGQGLQRFHSATPSVLVDDWSARQQQRLEEWLLHDTRGVLRKEETDLAEFVVGLLSDQRPVELVFAHRDWKPRNWMVDNGALYAFDFEHSRRDHWLSDVANLWFGEWAERADLAEAFFDGYGRSPSASDMEQLHVVAVLSCISTIVWTLHGGATGLAADARRTLANVRRSVAH